MFSSTTQRSNLPWILAAGGLAWWGLRQLRKADLRGCSVVITGGSRGLGLLLAREFARHGCRLMLCARDPEELEIARGDLEDRGADIRTTECDVAERAAVGELIDRANREFGGVDVLVNNAGIISVGPLEAASRDDFEQAMDVMFWGMVNPALAVLPQMLERGAGRIVNITSFGGAISVPHLLPYCCAKFAAVGFSEGLTAELAAKGVRVTTVIPGIMRNGSYLNALFRGQPEKEYGWFAAGAGLPLISVSGERAARRVVAATRRGDAVTFIGLPAAAAARLHGLFPDTSVRLLSWVNRLLPRSEARAGREPSDEQPGWQIAQQAPGWLDWMTSLGRSAAERNNETPFSEDGRPAAAQEFPGATGGTFPGRNR